MKLTKKRKAVLDALKKSKEALTVKQIHQSVPDVDLVTVYRAVDALHQAGVIDRLNLDSGEAHYEFQHEPHYHAVCSTCDRVIHFNSSDEKLKKLLNIDEFAIDKIEITVKGTCQKQHLR